VRPGDGTAAPRHLRSFTVTVRVAGALLLAAIAGFLLGACGGGGGSGVALSTRTGPTVTRATSTTVATTTAPPTTRTLPGRSTTVETTTVHVTTSTTTTARPTTTRPPLTVTVLPPTTSTTVQPTTTAPAPVAAPPTTTSTAAEPEGETPWGWIALVLGLAGLAIVGIVLWGRRRSRTESWTAHLADLHRRTLIALDAVVAQGSVVAGQIEALATEARDLERHAAGDEATSAVAPVRAGLDELAEALEADRTLRLATPPPTPDQLAYSDALIRQQAQQLRSVLRSP
jgi:hypothetical protein